MCLLKKKFASSVNCLSKSVGSWLCDETGQGWNEGPWAVVSPSSLESFKGQDRQILDEGGFKEIQSVGAGLA